MTPHTSATHHHHTKTHPRHLVKTSPHAAVMSDASPMAPKDEQPIPQTPSELRKHYFLNRYAIIAPKRNLRPSDLAKNRASHRTENSASPQIENEPAVYAKRDSLGNWLVKVIDNNFPAFTLDNPKAFGKQEIVIDTPLHNTEFSALPLEQIELVLETYIDRLKTLGQIKGVKYVVVFKNDGPDAGASLAHAHSQIFALPFIPPSVLNEAYAYTDYYHQHNRCAYCDAIEWEQVQAQRIVYEDEHIISITPYASSSAFDAWILPKNHAGSLCETTVAQRCSIARVLKQITTRLDGSNISYNFFVQESLPKLHQHLVIKVEPRTNVWGGLELSTGVVINPVPPEFAATWYQGSN